ncbi:MAG: NusG domain II-containing protein, partial [Acutalibacteraceae bacterium]
MDKPRGRFAVKPADFIIFALPLIIAAVCIMIFSSSADNDDIRIAKIILDGKTVQTVALDSTKNQTIDLGLEYGNIIEVRDGKVGIISADCPDKTCVKTGFISRPGQISVCVP